MKNGLDNIGILLQNAIFGLFAWVETLLYIINNVSLVNFNSFIALNTGKNTMKLTNIDKND